jgi:hypothetical protein
MHCVARIVVAVSLGVALLHTATPAQATSLHQAMSPQRDHVGVPTLDGDRPGIYGADTEFLAVIEAAIDRYDSSGLTLPALRIYIHPTSEGCQGHKGTYGQYGEADRVDLCTEAKFYVLHELAHAWERHTLSDLKRQTVLYYIERAVWHDRNRPWLDSGAEVVANNIAWALMDEPLSEPDANRYADLLDRFTLLTGAVSPRIE